MFEFQPGKDVPVASNRSAIRMTVHLLGSILYLAADKPTQSVPLFDTMDHKDRDFKSTKLRHF